MILPTRAARKLIGVPMVSTRKTAHPDAPTVIAFAGEMVTSTQAIIDGLNYFVAGPKLKPISGAVDSISATAKLISLRTVALLSDEIVHLAKQMESADGPAIQSEADAVRGALTAIQRYLSSASSGKLGSGLVVHAAYTELARSTPGRTALNRGEIFLPVFAMFGANSATYNEGKFIAEIGRYQDEFHQALLRYNQDKNFDTINAMRTTLVTMETKNPPAEFRMFFSLAIAFFDIALRAGGKISKEDEGLLNRIDRELADIVRGDLEVSETTLSWFLYVVAQATQFSARIRTFQDSYELTRMIDQEPSGIVSDQTLSSARTALDNSRRTWESAMVKNGDVKAAKSSTFALAAVCNTIGDYSLKTLSFAMGALADGVATDVVPVNPETAVFGASILLAIGDRLDSIVNDPKGGRALADSHKDRVRSVLSGKSPSELSSHVQVQQGYPQKILDEVHNNVSAAESIVDLCIREGIKESKSEEAIKLLSAASSAMMLINLMDGAEFADKVTGHVKSTLDQLLAKETVSEDHIMLMAEAVMLLDRYIKLVPLDLQQANNTLQKGMAMFEVPEEVVPTSTLNPEDGPFETPDEDDDGLGAIFYEEATEVIDGTILPAIEKLHSNLKDDVAFQDLRRGFHTVKGSARMVGLMHTGNVAQHAEHALNIVRDNKSVKLVPDMLVWLSSITTLIQQTVAHLQAGTPAKVDQAPFQAVYDAFAESFVFALEPGSVTSKPVVVEVLSEEDVGLVPSALDLVPDSLPKLEDTSDVSTHAQSEETAPVIADFGHFEEPINDDVVPEITQEMADEDLSITSDAVNESPLEAPTPIELESPIDTVAEADEVIAHEMPLHDEIQFDLSETIPSEVVPVLDQSSENIEILAEDNNSPEVVDVVDQPQENVEILAENDISSPPIQFNLNEDFVDTEGPPEIPETIFITEIEDLAAELPQSDGESYSMVTVGELEIPGSIYRAFLEESETFYIDLEALIRQMIKGKTETMDFEVIRLSHSLCGMGRTTGLKAITEVATNIETWASLKQDHRLHLDAETIEILRDSLEALEMMILGVKDRIEPISDTKLNNRMKALIEKEEHILAHGQDQSEMTPSVMERIEAGGEISDSGVGSESQMANNDNELVGLAVKTPEAAGFRFRQDSQAQNMEENRSLAEELSSGLNEKANEHAYSDSEESQKEGVKNMSTAKKIEEGQEKAVETYDTVTQDVLDEIAAISKNTVPEIPASVLLIDETIAESPESTVFPSTVALERLDAVENENMTVKDDLELEDIPLTEEFVSQLQQEVDSMDSTTNYEIEALGSDDRVDVIAQSVLIDESVPIVEEIAVAVSVVPETITESLPDVIIESSALHRPEAIFVAPELGQNTHVVVIDESVNMIPASVEMDIGTTTSVGQDYERPTKARSPSKPKGLQLWIEIVRAKEDDIAEEMKEIFIEEAEERFVEIDNALSTLATDVHNKKFTNSLKRGIHTLKGSANTAGARKIGGIFHYLEDLMNEAPVLNASLCVTIQSGVDAAFAAVDALKHDRSIDNAVARVSRESKAIGDSEYSSESISESAAESNSPSTMAMQESIPSLTPSQPSTITSSNVELTATGATPVREAVKASKKEDDSQTLRVTTNVLDRMVKSIGEINISRTRIGMNVDLTKMQMTGLATSLERMYGYLREIEMEAEKQMHTGTAKAKTKDSGFDALQMDRFTRLQELTRRVAEAQNDVMTQQDSALSAIRDMEEAVATQRILVSDVSSELDRVRQVRVSSMVPNLKRVVRAACRETGKLGEIYFDADVEIDRGILDKINAPIEHILRNAVAHGIEFPSDRLKSHKDETGSIEFRAYQDGSEVVIEIHDDGNGIDSGRVLQKAVDKGIVRPGTRMTEDKIRELLFEPGFSTAEAVTDISGRGVGLDVVRSEISAMGGRVDVQSTLGNGTTFILRLPATLTVIAGVSVMTESHMYVIPVSFIDRLVRVSSKDLEIAYKSQKLIVKETSGEQVVYDFWGMWQVVGVQTVESRSAQRGSIILMRGDRIAVHVDDIRPASEFVFRPMGPQLASNSGLIGSTINASGNATLVLDPARVVRNLKAVNAKLGKINGDARNNLNQQARMPLVLIVDDSTTVRKVTTRLLKKEGFRFAEAENGMQALERIQDECPDVILMDIEMPVMNGYEATQAIRATPETAEIPIIMITSRVGETHRQKAFDLGVNDYLGKPYNDFDLMASIKKHTQKTLEMQT